MNVHFRIGVSLLAALPQLSFAQLKDETLLLRLPPGYKLALQLTRENTVLREIVPKSETVDDWTEMISTQVFLGAKKASLDRFHASIKRQWSAACADSTVTSPVTGNENGYAYASWVMRCMLNPSTGKPEIAIVKTIQGNDSFYVVQKAFKFHPSDEQTERWGQYLRGITVCDTRLADRPCPDPKQQGFEEILR